MLNSKCKNLHFVVFKFQEKFVKLTGLLTPLDHGFAEPQHSSPQLQVPEFLVTPKFGDLLRIRSN